jgi:hypothetical protein
MRRVRRVSEAPRQLEQFVLVCPMSSDFYAERGCFNGRTPYVPRGVIATTKTKQKEGNVQSQS